MPTMTNAVTWFEIGTKDPTTTTRFYGDLFGWNFAKDKQYQEISSPGEGAIGGGVFPVEGDTPNYAIFYVQVADVVATVAAAEAAGGKVLVPPTGEPGGLTFAHLLDPTGNHFGVFTPPAAS